MNSTRRSRFARFLVESRAALDISATLCAAKCGVTKSMWSYFEHDNRAPNAAALYAMAQLFNVPMEQLFEMSRPEDAQKITKQVKA